MATVSKTTRGFKAPCPKCGEESVQVALWDVTELRCGSCDEEFTLDAIRDLVSGWARVISWLDTAPVYGE